jgi:hypothetical protein
LEGMIGLAFFSARKLPIMFKLMISDQCAASCSAIGTQTPETPALAQTAANELYGTGVRVNASCPGIIETGMTKPIYDQARARGTDDKIGQLNPLTRGGEPHEIANMGLFLASDEASYVNGQFIAVDGGLSSSHPVVRRRR